MKRNSKAWIWLLLLMYAFYAAYWSEKVLSESTLHPFRAWFGVTIRPILPVLQALLSM